MTNKGGALFSRQINVGVRTVQPFKCILNSYSSLLSKGMLLGLALLQAYQWSTWREKYSPVKKNSVDKGIGLWKLLVNPVTVQIPQILRHVQPFCEFTANDSRSNMTAAVFYNDAQCSADMDDVLHCWAVLLHVKVEEWSEVSLVVNTNLHHPRSKHMPLTTACHIHQYAPTAPYPKEGQNLLDSRVARVDFNIIHFVLLMYITIEEWFDKIMFADTSNISIAALTLTNLIDFVYCEPAQFDIAQYLLARIFTGDLDFLANFLN